MNGMERVGELAAATLAKTPRIGMCWHRGFVRGAGAHGDDLIIALDLDPIFRDDGDITTSAIGDLIMRTPA